MREELIRIENIMINNENISSLQGFYMNIFKGEIVGILTLNTLGKQHLIEVLCGIRKADFGRMYYDDVLYDGDDYKRIIKNKIFKIENIGDLAHDLTVADNIFTMRSEFNKYFIRKTALYRQTKMLFDKFNIKINPKYAINKLSSLDRSIVELMKAYAAGAKLVILLDLDNDLGSNDLKSLHEIVLKLKDEKISFLYVNSYVDMLNEFTERMIIMREGRNTFNISRKDFNIDKATSLILGKEYDRGISLRRANRNFEVILKFNNVKTENINKLSFDLRKGEVLNILDRNNKGNEDIIKLLNGSIFAASGEIFYFDRKFEFKHLSKIISEGIGFICENAVQNMLFKDMSLLENLCFMLGERVNNISFKFGLKKSIINEYYDKFKENIYIKDIDDLNMTTLIKLVYYKWHLYSPKLLVIIKPFTGVDMKLRKLVMDLIYELSNKGIAILVLTSNYYEEYVAGDRVISLEKS